MGKTTSEIRLSSSITILAASGGFTFSSVCCVALDSFCSSSLSSGCEVDAPVALSMVEKVAGSVSLLVEDSDEDSDDELLTESVVAGALELSSDTIIGGSITVTGVSASILTTSHWAVGINGSVLSVCSPALLSIKGASSGGDTDGTSTGVVVAACVSVLQHIVTSGVMELDGAFASLII